MKKRLIGLAILIAIVVGVLTMGKGIVPVEAGKPEGFSGNTVGNITAKAGSATLDLKFEAHGGKNVHGNVTYSNSSNSWFDGNVDLCYYQDGNEVAFGGTVMDGSYGNTKNYFLIEVQDGESTETPDRVRVRLFTAKPECKLSGSFPGIVIDGDIKIHSTSYQENVCTTIKDGVIEYGRVGDSNDDIIPIGNDQWGYNYQAHMFNGDWCDYHPAYRPGGSSGDWCEANLGDVELMMKWSDEWLSNKDCNDDKKLDRGYSCNPEEPYSSACPGAWLTNHEKGSYRSIVGEWILSFTYSGSEYVHDMEITAQDSDFLFEGIGGYPSGMPYSHEWEVEGELVGNNVSFNIVYLTGNQGYEVDAVGEIHEAVIQVRAVHG